MSLLKKCVRYAGKQSLHIAYLLRNHFLTNYKEVRSANGPRTHIRYLEEELPEDMLHVLEISAQLEIKEFHLFDLAYRWWFGRVASDHVLENHFARYMIKKIVPDWVRQYCRMILELQAQNKLDRAALGIENLPDSTPQSVRAGLRYTVMLIFAMGLLVLFAELAVQIRRFGCMFPPCY